jgi:hypothetical protein
LMLETVSWEDTVFWPPMKLQLPLLGAWLPSWQMLWWLLLRVDYNTLLVTMSPSSLIYGLHC